MEVYEQLKELWEKIKDCKKLADLYDYYEEASCILYQHCLFKFSDMVLIFGESKAFELSDLDEWMDDFKDIYNYINNNNLII